MHGQHPSSALTNSTLHQHTRITPLISTHEQQPSHSSSLRSSPTHLILDELHAHVNVRKLLTWPCEHRKHLNISSWTSDRFTAPPFTFSTPLDISLQTNHSPSQSTTHETSHIPPPQSTDPNIVNHQNCSSTITCRFRKEITSLLLKTAIKKVPRKSNSVDKACLKIVGTHER